LGTHISRVKSATLDKWTDEQIEVMQRMGNANAKLLYEANVPDTYARPQQGCSNHVLENWIRAKYVKKEFMDKKASKPPKKEGRKHARKEGRKHHSRKQRSSEESAPVASPTKPRAEVSPPSLAPSITPVLSFDTLAFSKESQPRLDKDSILSLYHQPLAPAAPLSAQQSYLQPQNSRPQPNYNVKLPSQTPAGQYQNGLLMGQISGYPLSLGVYATPIGGVQTGYPTNGLSQTTGVNGVGQPSFPAGGRIPLNYPTNGYLTPGYVSTGYSLSSPVAYRPG